jgi:methylated-DNA-[protein]-cysteine S-methyltransferase
MRTFTRPSDHIAGCQWTPSAGCTRTVGATENNTAMTEHTCTMPDTPVGPIAIVANGPGITGLYLGEPPERVRHLPVREQQDDPFATAIRQLTAYFAGKLTEFDLLLDPVGTPFQRRVWTALREIPFGSTASYGELAERIGSPTAARAVGAANGRNPIGIVVPCHRVISSNGTLNGYAGGVERKKYLLEMEKRVRSVAELAGRSTADSRIHDISPTPSRRMLYTTVDG